MPIGANPKMLCGISAHPLLSALPSPLPLIVAKSGAKLELIPVSAPLIEPVPGGIYRTPTNSVAAAMNILFPLCRRREELFIPHPCGASIFES